MFLLYVLLLIVGSYLLLYWFVPKGRLIHELLRLPQYQYFAQTRPRDNMDIEKHFFGSHRRQYLLHCTPKNGATQNKVVIYYHGGGWSLGTPEMFRINAQFFVNQGYEVFMPSYRRIPQYRYPAIRSDLSSALKKIKEIMETRGIGDQKIILGGMSAGGNLVALMCYDRSALATLGYSQDMFAGLLLCGAPLNLNQMSPSPVLWAYAGSQSSPTFQQANPIEHLSSEESIPVLCLHGKKDGLVQYPSAASFIKKIKTIQSNNVEMITIKEGTHLDVGSWNFHDNELRRQLTAWLERLV